MQIRIIGPAKCGYCDTENTECAEFTRGSFIFKRTHVICQSCISKVLRMFKPKK